MKNWEMRERERDLTQLNWEFSVFHLTPILSIYNTWRGNRIIIYLTFELVEEMVDIFDIWTGWGNGAVPYLQHTGIFNSPYSFIHSYTRIPFCTLLVFCKIRYDQMFNQCNWKTYLFGLTYWLPYFYKIMIPSIHLFPFTNHVFCSL